MPGTTARRRGSATRTATPDHLGHGASARRVTAWDRARMLPCRARSYFPSPCIEDGIRAPNAIRARAPAAAVGCTGIVEEGEAPGVRTSYPYAEGAWSAHEFQRRIEDCRLAVDTGVHGLRRSDLELWRRPLLPAPAGA